MHHFLFGILLLLYMFYFAKTEPHFYSIKLKFETLFTIADTSYDIPASVKR